MAASRHGREPGAHPLPRLGRWRGRPGTRHWVASSQAPLDCGDCIVRLDTVCQGGLNVSATFSLFERWKAAKGFTKDSDAAKALGVTRAAVSLWKTGRNGGPSVIYRMAEDLGDEPTKHVLASLSEATANVKDKKTLARLARRLGAACLAVLALAPWMIHSRPSEATGGANGTPERVHLIHYAKWLLRALGRFGTGFAVRVTPSENSTCAPLALCPASP